MRTLAEYIKMMPPEPFILEMATISKSTRLDRTYKRIAVHGPESGDRENPHIHIYDTNDTKPYNKFNFEISLTDILSKDEINLIKMRDQAKGIMINNRSKCSWNSYTKLYNDFEDWLFSDKVDKPGEWINNLEAVIYFYNDESYGDGNPLLKYMEERGMKVLEKYFYLFSDEDKKTYKFCFT